MDYGFDSIKLDGCGAELDLYKFAALLNNTGKAFLVENCHWGNTIPANQSDCPYSYYRTSGDIEASYGSVMANLQTLFPHADKNLSFPNCWGYPDALEVGCSDGPHGPGGDPGLSFVEARAHFAAWAITSSPLILAHDLLNQTLNDAIWPIIANTEVSARAPEPFVGAAWHTHHRALVCCVAGVPVLPRPLHFPPHTLSFLQAIAVSQTYAGFSGSLFKAAAETVDVGGRFGALPAWQYLYKPLGNATVAVLLMNHASTTATLQLTFSDVPTLPPPGAHGYAVRDLNAHADLGTFAGSYTAAGLVSHDAAFLALRPA
jgi:hypothetical protein